MRQRLSKYFNAISDIRRRSVHLLYLIFLILIFAFIPSDKGPVSSIDETDLVNLSQNNEALSTSNTILFLHLIQQRPDLYQEIKFRAIEIERGKVKCTEFIQALMDIIENDGRVHSIFQLDKDLVSQKSTDSLFQLLSIYKNSITELTNYEDAETINEILPLNKYVQDKHGKYISHHNYYFSSSAKKSIAYLKLISAQINQLYAHGLYLLNSDIARKYADLDDLDLLKLSQNENFIDLFNHKSISAFFKQIESEDLGRAPIVNQESNGFKVQSMHSNAISVGNMVHYKINIVDEGIQNLNITVRRINQQSYFSITTSGDFYFFPQEEGNYIFTFRANEHEYRDQLYIQESKSLFCADEETVFFKGIENKLEIDAFVKDKNWSLEFECTNGEAQRTYDALSIVPDNTGKGIVSVYGLLPYGRILICKKNFKVFELPLPTFSILQAKNGSAINLTDFIRIESASLIQPIESKEVYELLSFNCTVLRGSSQEISKTYYNRSASFQSGLKLLLRSVNKGDKILIDEIAVKTQSSKIYQLPPYTIIIK